ncbi:MAG: hypothetical protein ACFFG0_11515 [Candidatus Thorarchaeota archaeon]
MTLDRILAIAIEKFELVVRELKDASNKVKAFQGTMQIVSTNIADNLVNEIQDIMDAVNALKVDKGYEGKEEHLKQTVEAILKMFNRLKMAGDNVKKVTAEIGAVSEGLESEIEIYQSWLESIEKQRAAGSAASVGPSKAPPF